MPAPAAKQSKSPLGTLSLLSQLALILPEHCVALVNSPLLRQAQGFSTHTPLCFVDPLPCSGLLRWPFSSVTELNSLSSVTQLFLTLCDPMDCSTPGLPVHHQLSEFTQTYVH